MMETSDPPAEANAASSSTAEPPEVALVRAQLAQLLDDSAAAQFASAMSGGNYMFVIVAEGDAPIYEAEFVNAQKVRASRCRAPQASRCHAVVRMPCP